MRNAFTLVELIVLLAIIAVLAALLTPAVIQARNVAMQQTVVDSLVVGTLQAKWSELNGSSFRHKYATITSETGGSDQWRIKDESLYQRLQVGTQYRFKCSKTTILGTDP